MPFKRRADSEHGPAAALAAELAAARAEITEIRNAIGPLRAELRDHKAALIGHQASLAKDRTEVRAIVNDLKSALGRLPAAEPAPPAPPAAPKGDGAGTVLQPATSEVLRPAKASRARTAPKDGPA